jgi:putative ABC transport system permease protein
LQVVKVLPASIVNSKRLTTDNKDLHRITHKKQLITSEHRERVMIKNYLKVAARHLRRHKLYSTINVTGLAVGFAVALLIGLFVWEEWSHDAFHTQGEQIYRIVGQEEETGNRTAVMDGPLAPLVDEHLPQIERFARTASSSVWLGEGDAQVEEEVYFADPAFLEMFSFPLAVGTPATALDRSDAVVLSQNAAQRFFGSENPVGKTLPIEFRRRVRETTVHEATVTGVLEPIPSASSLQFDVLLPLEAYAHVSSLGEKILTHRRHGVGDTFVHLPEKTNVEEVATLINDVVEQHYEDIPTGHSSRESIEQYALQPLDAMYFSPEIESRTVTSSNPLHSYVLGGIGGLVLLLACINFSTLAIGRSSGRANEVGMRKVAGARPAQVRLQFWSEAFLVATAALLLGLLLAWLTLPVFNTLADRALTLAPLASPTFVACVVGGLFLVSLVAGGYPAWVLSHFDPSAVLRGSSSGGSGRRAGLISGLVVAQFALSIALLIGAIVMDRQLRHVQQQELGFDREQVLAVENTADIDSGDLLARLRQQLEPYPEVSQVGGTSQVFGLPETNFRLTAGDSLEAPVHRLSVDEHYREAMGIELLAGRDLFPTDGSGNPSALVNEALVEAMGWSHEEALGQRLLPQSGNMKITSGEVVGIVENFHLRSLHHALEPTIISHSPTFVNHVLIRMAPGATGATLQQVEAAWHEAAPDAPFVHRFLDEVVQAQYEDDRRWATVVRYAVVLALLISCFGLFGLSALAARRRYREIGIRKVLGATTASIVALLSKDFLRLVGAAFVLAAPAAYIAAQRWLEDFAYRIELGPWVFLMSGLAALLIALLTVSTQALRAAWADPATAIRQE